MSKIKGLYIHIPFCRQKCKYCDFISYAGREGETDRYIEAVKREAKEYEGEKIDTVFIGGGTPSLLTPKQIKEITRMCFGCFDISKNYEFTMEINPGTLDDEKICAMLEGGVNRVSVGVQSFNDNELSKIGRIHDAKSAYNTICHLKEKGFSNISLDLMTALPSQSMKSLKNTLSMAAALPVKHISAYSLIIEDNTPLEREYSKGLLTLPDEDTDRDMYHFVVEFLRKNGFNRYEISNFAQEGFECRHNIKYWRGEEYIGLGTAAHSYINGIRSHNSDSLEEYIEGAERERIKLTQSDKMAEFIITGLRMSSGISASDFKQRFDCEITDIYNSQLEKFIKLNLIKTDGDRYMLTCRGIDISNSVLCEFV